MEIYTLIKNRSSSIFSTDVQLSFIISSIEKKIKHIYHVFSRKQLAYHVAYLCEENKSINQKNVAVKCKIVTFAT